MFKSLKEVNEYLSGDRIQCLICHKWYQSLATHLLYKHEMTIKQYKILFNIPLKHGYGLVGIILKAKLSQQGKKNAILEVFKQGRQKSINNPVLYRKSQRNNMTQLGLKTLKKNLPDTKGKILGSKLDSKHTEIVDLLVKGKTRMEIAQFYNISWATIDKFIKQKNLHGFRNSYN